MDDGFAPRRGAVSRYLWSVEATLINSVTIRLPSLFANRVQTDDYNGYTLNSVEPEKEEAATSLWKES